MNATARPGQTWRNGRDAAHDGARAAIDHLAARKAAKHASAVIAAMRDALLIVDEHGAITDVNGAFCAMTGFDRHQLIGKRSYPFWSRRDAAANAAAIGELVRNVEVGAAEVELSLTRKSGDRFRASVSLAPLRGGHGEPIGYASTLREILPAHDEVTAAVDAAAAHPTADTSELPPADGDRAVFDRALLAELSRAQRHARDLSLIVLEVDDIASRSTEGAAALQNRVLAAIEEVLRGLVRTSDSVVRIRPDAFAWLLPETDPRSATVAAERARAFISAITLPGGYGVTASFGIAEAETACYDGHEIHRQAELALHQAKAGGPGSIARFGSEEAGARAPLFADDSRRQTLASLRLLARVLDRTCARPGCRSEEVADLSERMARQLGWSAADARLLYEAALVREVGMLGVPESLRGKRQALTAVEREQLQSHPVLGAELVSQVLTYEQVSWVRHHHERYDGAGYPSGRRGEGIPSGARLIAVADAWVELRADQESRSSTAEILSQLQHEAGWQFCPTAVTALGEVLRSERSVTAQPVEAGDVLPATPAPSLAAV